MASDTTRPISAEALKQRLSEIDITLAQVKDGRFCAYTSCEPLFCFEADTERELVEIVKNALVSYFTFKVYDLVGGLLRAKKLADP